MEQAKPWTAIIMLNEEYYIAQKEKMSGIKLPIIRLKSRKVQQEAHPTLLSSKPWEKYTSKEISSLYIDYDAEKPSHKGFDLQEQATRDRQEKHLKAVFIDSIVLKVPYELGLEEKTHYVVEFNLTRTPSQSDTRKAIREEIHNFKERFHLYPDISKKDTVFYKRVFQNPSCLEISQVEQVANPYSHPITDEILNGLSFKSQRFMANLQWITKSIVSLAFKKFDTRSGFVLDGLVPRSLIHGKEA